jgi:lysophospholipase L1-like esterase
MAVTQYIGARYVPLFADPIDWDINSEYEPLTIVYHQGNSYTSRQSVPKGIDIANDSYWVITGNYNAQVEQYRQEVRAFDGRITTNAQAIAGEVRARMQEDTAIRAIITTLNNDLATEETARETADTQIRTDFAAADTQIRTDFAAADTQIRTDFAAADTQIRKDVATDKFPGYSAIWIGDSYVQANSLNSPTTRFSRQVCDALGLTEYNFALGGTGFLVDRSDVSGDNTFKGQLAEAIADTSIDKSKVKYVFVAGGRNDSTLTTVPSGGAIGAAIYPIFSMVKNNYPNATLVLIPMLYDSTAMTAVATHLYGFFTYLFKSATAEYNINVQIIENAFMWLNGRYKMIFNKDKIHPNQTGHNLIARMIIGNLHGRMMCPAIDVSLPFIESLALDSSSFMHIFSDTNGTIWLHGKIRTTNGLAWGAKIINTSYPVIYGDDGTDVLINMRTAAQIPLTGDFNSSERVPAIEFSGQCNMPTEQPTSYINVTYLGETFEGIKRFDVFTPIGILGTGSSDNSM